MAKLRLRPSAAGIWGAPLGCQGSVRMCAEVPPPEEDTDEAALEGSAAHDLGSRVLIGQELPRVALNGIPFTEEMHKHVKTYVEYINRLCASIPHHSMYVEREISIPRVHKTCRGTPDVVIVDYGNNVIHVLDFKYGFGPVSAWENYQLLCYASGIQSRVGMKAPRFISHIVQPRSPHIEGPIRTWEIDNDTFEWYQERLRYGAEQALSDDPRIRTGPHCRHCRARHACKPAQQSALHCVDFIGRAVPEHLDAAGLSLELTILEQATRALKVRKTGIEAQINSMLRKGERIPDYTLAPSTGRLNWTAPRAAVLALGAAMGVEVDKPGLVTPTQAIAAGVSKEMISGFAARKQGGMKLKRIDKSYIKQIFSKEGKKLDGKL